MSDWYKKELDGARRIKIHCLALDAIDALRSARWNFGFRSAEYDIALLEAWRAVCAVDEIDKESVIDDLTKTLRHDGVQYLLQMMKEGEGVIKSLEEKG